MSSESRASFESDIQGHLAGRQREANELYEEIEKARRGDARDEEIAALTEKYLKFQTKLKEDVVDLKNSVTPGKTLPDDAVRRVAKLLLHSVKGRCAPEWRELDAAVELLLEKIGRGEFPGMQSAATISLGAWMTPFVDSADVIMFQCSCSEYSGADPTSKIAGREMTVAKSATDV